MRRRAAASVDLAPSPLDVGCLVCPPLRSPPRAARTYVNHCMIIVRILDILMIVSAGWSREWRGGARAHPLISAAAARVILIP